MIPADGEFNHRELNPESVKAEMFPVAKTDDTTSKPRLIVTTLPSLPVSEPRCHLGLSVHTGVADVKCQPGTF